MKKIGILLSLIVLGIITVMTLASCGEPEIVGLTFADSEVEYDGAEHTMEVSGLPEGATVTYALEGPYKDAGEYQITATVKQEGFADKVITAKLTISPKAVTVSYSGLSFKANGEVPEITYTVNDLIEGDTVELEFDFGDCDFTETGDGYTFKAKSKNPNYTLKKVSAEKEFELVENVHTVYYDTGVEGVTLDPEEEVNDNGRIRAPRSINNSGYDFLGWFNGEEQWDFDNDRVKGDMTLVAKWQPKTYTISYQLNGGVNFADNPKAFVFDVGAEIYAPKKEGYIFLGWYSDRELTTPAKELAPKAVSKDVTLFAKWSEVDYTKIISGANLDAAIVSDKTLVNGRFRYTLSANITSFADNGVIRIGRGFGARDGSYVEITATEIRVITIGEGEKKIVQSKKHSRNVQCYFAVDVTVNAGKASVTLHTVDGACTQSFDFLGRNGEIFASMENATLKDVNFGWADNAVTAPVWVIGGADIGSNQSNSWTTQLVTEKFDDVMFIGVNGATSTDVLAATKEALKSSVPEYIIWSFSKESGTAYEANLAEFLTLCDDKQIIPVLTTHLEAEDSANAAKNSSVKTSERKYIDFAALASDSRIYQNGAYTEHGAKAMMAKLFVDFPEFITPTTPIRTESADVLNYTTGKLLLDGGRDNRVRDGKHLIFTAKLDGTLGEQETVSVGHGQNTNYSNWVEITGKNLLFYYLDGAYKAGDVAKPQSTTRHNLTIKNYITVIISADDDRQGDLVTIVTEGGSFTKKVDWNASNGAIFASVSGAELTDAKMNWTCVDYTEDIWLIGASFFSLGADNRWPYYLYEDKYDDNIFIAGLGGMNGPEGIDELKYSLSTGHTPKALAWGVGMNDGADKGTISQSYYDSLLELMEICEENGIKLYIMTIPTTTKYDNTYKTNFVLDKTGDFANYDYEVIDIARAVNAKVNPGWYDHMLSSDEVHPNRIGARAFYLQFLCDFPELMGGIGAAVYEKTQKTLTAGSVIKVEENENAKRQSAIVFSADFFGSSLSGTIEIGNGKGSEGSSYVAIDKDYVKVYTIENGKKVLVCEAHNQADMKDLVNVAIHVNGSKAKISIMSSAEKNYDPNNVTVFSVETYWSAVGDAYASVTGQSLTNANLKWHTWED